MDAICCSLIPGYAKFDGKVIPNDARRIINLVLNRPDKTEGSSWKSIIESSPVEPLLVGYRKQLENPRLKGEQRGLALDAFATAVLMYGSAEHLEEASRYSEELLRLKPDEWTVKGTRGSILIDLGRIDEGIAMLSEVMAKDPSKFDRAICACFLALGEYKRNRLYEAREWAETARQIDPNCGPFHRIKFLLPP